MNQSFFPQLLIGPICRSRDLLPQIEAEPAKHVPNTSEAMVLLMSGLFKKMILSSLLFEYGVMDPFQDPEAYSAAALWLAIAGYSVQLYCDFSGYTDMARGFALLLGFHIPDTKAPYATTNLGEFWQRWHITFFQWLRDYVYIPLGGSLVSSSGEFSPIHFLTFFGLWYLAWC